jgi:hypothetical protein
LNIPVAVGVPLIVIILLFHDAVNPAGRPDTGPIPVAPVVVKVMLEDNAVLTQRDGVADALVTVLTNTVIVPVALMVPHPPVNGIV